MPKFEFVPGEVVVFPRPRGEYTIEQLGLAWMVAAVLDRGPLFVYDKPLAVS